MTMNDAFKKLFGPIQAEEALKDHTKAFLAKQTQNYTRSGAATRGYPAYAAACMCLLLISLGCHWLFFVPTAEISIDINPSIELSVNRLDQVIAVNSFNEDGRELSGALDIKYENYAKAVEQILDYDSVTAMLSDGEIVTITVVCSDGRRSAKILSGIETCTAGHSNTYCYFARSEDVAAAHEMGLSCGKFRAYSELRLLDPDVTPETVRGMTMREIQELIEGLSSDENGDASSYNRWGNGHHGQGDGHGNKWRNISP